MRDTGDSERGEAVGVRAYLSYSTVTSDDALEAEDELLVSLFVNVVAVLMDTRLGWQRLRLAVLSVSMYGAVSRGEANEP